MTRRDEHEPDVGDDLDEDDKPLTEAEMRAAEIGARPEVRRWVKRFRKLVADMPADVEVFCESGRPYVMALRPSPDKLGGLGYLTGRGGVDQDAIIARIERSPSGGGWDGGGW